MLAPPFLGLTAAADEADPFAHPPTLEPDIRFWVRVYTEVTTDQGVLHDDRNLKLVYEVLRFDAASPPAQRQHLVAEAKARYAALLRRFAAGTTTDLTAHEKRILDAFGEKARPEDFLDAIDRIRFQLGQADRFHEGLIRSAAWETNIARVLKRHGVPEEIAALPHVESSFNPEAYSKVGAAGLWQFMPSTAKRFMRVDGLVDERLDPFTATEAAANLMLYNYRLLGSWPLTVTAYNHGPGGLRRAQDELGTDDIAVIVKRYQGSTFGFASRNFYVAFLAALEVDRHAEKYFGPLTRLPETDNTPVELPDYIAVTSLAKAFKVDLGALKVLNPALRPPIWNGSRLVPRGYALRLPGSQSPGEVEAAWARVPMAQRYLAQRNDGAHKIRKGETLATIASASGVSLSRLLAANGWNAAHTPARGEVVRIPMPASRGEGGVAGAGESAPGEPPEAAVAAQSPSRAPAQDETTPSAPPPTPPTAAEQSLQHPTGAPERNATAARREPVSPRQTDSAALLPASPPTGGPDVTDYGVGAGDTVVVQAGETLGHFADWTQVESQTLRKLNRLHQNAQVTVGHKIKLDLSKVPSAQFVAARTEYHHHLQEAFFAAHRIAGTENYTVKRGESLWTVALQHGDLPIWLVAQYNPDVDFHDLRPGITIALPQVVDINRQ
jgi:membrane-bound lytic murein transglycosylase D